MSNQTLPLSEPQPNSLIVDKKRLINGYNPIFIFLTLVKMNKSTTKSQHSQYTVYIIFL